MNNKHHEQAKLNVHVINCRSLFFLHAIYCYVVYLVLMIILRLPCRYLHTVAKSRHTQATDLRWLEYKYSWDSQDFIGVEDL